MLISRQTCDMSHADQGEFSDRNVNVASLFSPMDSTAWHSIYVTVQRVCVCLSVQMCLRKRCKVRERV